MNVILIFAIVILVLAAVLVSWIHIILKGFSKVEGIRTGRPRRKEEDIQISQMRKSGELNIYLEALFSVPALGFAVPGVAGMLQVIQEGELWALIGVALGGGAIGMWVYAGGRMGLWQVWRDVFSRRTTMKDRVNEHWVKNIKTPGFEGEYGSNKYYGVTVDDQPFNVSERIYNWLCEGDIIVVHYWPHSKRVTRIEKSNV